MNKLEFYRIFTFLAYFVFFTVLFNFNDALSLRPRKNRFQNQQVSTSPPKNIQHGQDIVVFDTNISNPNQSGMFVECDLINYGDLTQLPYPGNVTFEVKELNLRSDTVRNPWMSCRFVRWLYKKWKSPPHYDDYTPPWKPFYPFNPYYNVSLSGARGNGSVTHIVLNDTGIFVEGQLLSQWGVGNESAISLDPGYKLLNSRHGHQCKGICNKTTSMERYVCRLNVFVYEQCQPRADYDIRKYAYDGILSIESVPCVSKCEWTLNDWGYEYMCQVRRYSSYRAPSKEICSPSSGIQKK